MNAVGRYLLAVAAASLLTGFLQALLPEGKIRKAAALTGSLILMLAVLSPVVKLDASNLARAAQNLQIDTQAVRSGAEESGRTLLARLISQRCEEYIWDKAAQRGLQLKIEITVGGDGEVPVPVSASVEGVYSGEDQAVLSGILTQELGIPPEKQEWNGP